MSAPVFCTAVQSVKVQAGAQTNYGNIIIIIIIIIIIKDKVSVKTNFIYVCVCVCVCVCVWKNVSQRVHTESSMHTKICQIIRVFTAKSAIYKTNNAQISPAPCKI